jgi:hypothetical protein
MTHDPSYPGHSFGIWEALRWGQFRESYHFQVEPRWKSVAGTGTVAWEATEHL